MFGRRGAFEAFLLRRCCCGETLIFTVDEQALLERVGMAWEGSCLVGVVVGEKEEEQQQGGRGETAEERGTRLAGYGTETQKDGIWWIGVGGLVTCELKKGSAHTTPSRG